MVNISPPGGLHVLNLQAKVVPTDTSDLSKFIVTRCALTRVKRSLPVSLEAFGCVEESERGPL